MQCIQFTPLHSESEFWLLVRQYHHRKLLLLQSQRIVHLFLLAYRTTWNEDRSVLPGTDTSHCSYLSQKQSFHCWLWSSKLASWSARTCLCQQVIRSILWTSMCILLLSVRRLKVKNEANRIFLRGCSYIQVLDLRHSLQLLQHSRTMQKQTETSHERMKLLVRVFRTKVSAVQARLSRRSLPCSCSRA